jgi:endonuclease/exonuclease/phosphatase family metal-dependent hydrolase
MPKFHVLLLVTLAVLLEAPTVPPRPVENSVRLTESWPAPVGDLSVMTYNIKDLPWPVASGRTAAVEAIGRRLAAMRAKGVQPDVVLLQEAFGDEARAIGRVAGYAHTIAGPSRAGRVATPPLGPKYADAAQFLKGETSGSVLNGGLVILSDLPISRIERHAFPEGACAGFDCLAAKGALIAWARIPGASQPVVIVDTHLNSRHSTHVPAARADAAYRWQVAALRQWLNRRIAPGTPVIIGGDFNTGRVAARLASFSRPLLGKREQENVAALMDKGAFWSSSKSEIQGLVERNKDKILSRDGAQTRLIAERTWVPFGLTERQPLSDHAGVVVDFSVVS